MSSPDGSRSDKQAEHLDQRVVSESQTTGDLLLGDKQTTT